MQEFDVLRIVNLLRTQEFMSQVYFKAHQLMLIKFFGAYTLYVKDEVEGQDEAGNENDTIENHILKADQLGTMFD